MTTFEVRFYYLGRLDWDMENFEATSPTDAYNKAKSLSEQRKASHFNCSIATAADEQVYRHERPMRKSRMAAAPANVKDQVALIEDAIGLARSKQKD